MSDVIEFRPKAGASGVIATPTHEEITHALRECHSESLLAVIRGGFGVGKTHTLERYVAAHECDAAMVTFSPSTRSLTAGLGAACKAVGQLWEWHFSQSAPVTSYTTGSAHAARLALERFCREIAEEGGRVLLILDEAQHARLDLLEELRAIHDMKACACGLVIAGNDSLFDALRGRMEAAAYGALLSRAHHVIDRPEPLPEDVAAVLEAHRIKGAEARKLLAHHAAAGGLRKLFQIVQKARELSDGAPPNLLQLKAAAGSTGLTATGFGRR
ncbi:MAG TPA: ATP-binding protein [Kiloniellaceae bacterium]